LRKPSTAMNRPIDALKESLIWTGTIRVTTLRRPLNVRMTKAIPDQKCDAQSDWPGDVLGKRRLTRDNHRSPIPGPTNKRKVGVERHQERAAHEQ